MSKKGFLSKLFSSSDELTLTELQKEIYRRENDIVKLNTGAGQNQAKIDEKNEKITADKKALERRSENLRSKVSDFATRLASDKRDPKNAKVKKEQALWTQQLKDAQKELQDHKGVIDTHQQEQELESQKLVAQNQKAAQDVELSYQQQKEKTFKIATDLLGDQEGLRSILAPLAEPRKSAKGVSAGQKWRTFKKGVSFAWDHSSVLREAVASKSFYQNEAAKVQAMIAGEAEYDPANPPFFIRLLKDPDTIKMLSGNVQILSNLTKELTPFLTDIVLKELGKIDTIQQEFNAQKKDIEALPKLYETLESLQKAEKPNESKITELEQKIQKLESLQASYERAVLLQALQGAGIDGKYIKDKLLPVVQEVVASVLEKPEMLVKVGNLAADMMLTKDPKQKQALQAEILNTIDINALTKNAKLSSFLLNEGQNIAKAAGVIIGSNPKLTNTLDSLQVSDSLIQDGIPLVLEFVGKILQNSEGVGTLYEALKPVILDNTPDKIAGATTLEEVQKLDKAKLAMVLGVAAKLPDILLQGDLLIVVKEKLPEFLDKHKETLAKVAEAALPKLLKNMKDEGEALAGKCNGLDAKEVYAIIVVPLVPLLEKVDPKFYGQAVPLVIDLVKSTMDALSADEIKAINASLKILMKEDVEIAEQDAKVVQAKIAEKDKAQGEIIKIVTHVFENEAMQEVLAKKLPALLKENSEVIHVIGNNVANLPELKKYELNKDLVDATTSLVVNVASTGLAQIPKLMEINKAFTKYTAPDASKENKKEALGGIISSAEKVVSELSPILETAIPEYLRQNKEHLLAVTGKVIAQEGMKAQLDKAGVPADLAMEMAGVALDTVPALLPIVTKFANAVLADQQGVETIVTKVQDLGVLLEKEKKAGTEKEKDKVKKEIDASGTVLAHSVLDFINNPENPKVKEVIDQDIPKFLENNAKQIGETLDKFLNNTVIGRNLKIQGEEIIKVVSKKVPGIVDIATQYQKGKYFSVMSGIVGLLRDPEVRHLVARGAVEGFRYVIQKSYTSYRTRRNKWSENLNTITEGLQAFSEVEQGKEKNVADQNKEKNAVDQNKEKNEIEQDNKKDLGALLLNVVKEKKLGELSKTVEYMFIDKDLKGIVFDKANPVPLENIAIKGFSFDKAVFMDRSFNNSEITDCSFAQAQFKGAVSFDGATIDAKSLTTLLPAIRKYNEKNKENPITLDNVKIVGDISQISFKDIQMENPDLTGATLGKGKALMTHFKDAYVGGNPKLPKSEELNAKAQEIGAEIGPHLAQPVEKSAMKHAQSIPGKAQGSSVPGV